MKKLLTAAFSILILACVSASAQMTDQQVIEYLKEANAEGKSTAIMQQELLQKGVNLNQVKRIKMQIEKDKSLISSTKEKETSAVNPRQQKNSTTTTTTSKTTTATRANNTTNVTSATAQQTTAQTVALDPLADPDAIGQQLESAETDGTEEPGVKIYGHDVFQNDQLTFEPNENVATPEDYRLGPGDEVIIEIWGYNEATVNHTLSPEGKINVSQIGPIYLSGLTIAEASEKIKKALIAKYSGIGGESPSSDVSITLGSIRSIQVNVMGEVNVPGTYRLSSFSTVFTALYRAGGVTETGSLRAIQVSRGGKPFATVDVYGYLFKGNSESDIRLQEGDVIIVPPYVNLVDMQGGVKRPMLYELAEGETVADAISYAGGFSSDAHRGDVSIERKLGEERSVITVSSANMASAKVEDGDVINIAPVFEKYSNRLEIQGYVSRPGFYELGGDIKTVKDLVNAAGGLREDAFLARAVIQREQADLSMETVAVPIGDIMSGKAVDVALAKNDLLLVQGAHEMDPLGTLTINGMVVNPGIFPFASNTTVEDLIIQAGGLLDGASTARVEVSRRIMESGGVVQSDTLGFTYQFSIKDGLAVDGAKDFVLAPYDVVSVRRSPTYQEQMFVTVTGEVAFPGTYVIQNRNETVTDIIARAGGITPKAYLKGGVIVRTLNEDEKNTKDATKKLLKMDDSDSLDEAKMNLSDKYTVGIMMDKAYESPHSSYDLTVREGDEIVVPQYLSTVSIQGDVMYPNVVQYVEGKNLGYYISSAGGYGLRAKRSGTFMVCMNGNVKKMRSGTNVEPGAVIIVPTKGERAELKPTELMSLGTSTASIATMVITLIKSL